MTTVPTQIAVLLAARISSRLSMFINPNTFLAVHQAPADGLLSWLTHQGSLTAKLKQEAGLASLQVLEQVWETPNWCDRHALNLDCELVMHREILMSAGQEPCWYARTILPQDSNLHDLEFFNRLQSEPLTQLIFDNNRVERVSLVNYATSPKSIEYHWLTHWMDITEDALWARMAVYTIDKHFPFYLIEILLPGLLRCLR